MSETFCNFLHFINSISFHYYHLLLYSSVRFFLQLLFLNKIFNPIFFSIFLLYSKKSPTCSSMTETFCNFYIFTNSISLGHHLLFYNVRFFLELLFLDKILQSFFSLIFFRTTFNNCSFTIIAICIYQ